MRKVSCLFIIFMAPICASHPVASESIWRCGQDITDDPKVAARGRCHLLTHQRIAISTLPRLQRDDQRTRDNTSRTILEAELRQAELRYFDLSRSSTNNENAQAEIMRTRGDIAALRREIERIR